MDKQKKKGPIRFEAIVPFGIVCAATGVYFSLFFDGHLRRGVEWAATEANGAEVNVGSLKTNFLSGAFSMGQIQVTDPSAPAKNRVQIGEVKFKFLWDALLRAKFVIDIASVNGIELNTPRKSPGYLVPPSTNSMSGRLMSYAKDRLSKTSLGDVAKVLEGVNPLDGLKEIQGSLKSLAKVEATRAELDKKEKEWGQTLATLPNEKDLASVRARLTAISTGGGSNPAELAQRVSSVKSLIQESETKIASVKSVGDKLTADVNGFSGAVKEIEAMIAQDRADLEKRLRLPSIDAKSLGEQLFGQQVLSRVADVQRYSEMGRRYLAAKKKDPEEEVKPARGKGRDYHFPVTTGYPKFWLKKAEISSKGDYSALGGDVSGEIRDVTSSPAQLGRPTVAILKGDFAKQNIRSVEAKLTLDHTKDVAVDSIQAKVGSFPVERQMLTESDSLKLGFAKAVGSASLEAQLKGDEFVFGLGSAFEQVSYDVQAQSKLLEQILQGVVKEVPRVTLQAKVSGKLDQPEIAIDSNLASALGRGFEKQLQAKLAEARKAVDELIQKQVGEPKRQLLARYEAARAQLTAQVESRRKEVEALKGQAQAKLASLTKTAAPAPVQNAVDQLKKKLPF